VIIVVNYTVKQAQGVKQKANKTNAEQKHETKERKHERELTCPFAHTLIVLSALPLATSPVGSVTRDNTGAVCPDITTLTDMIIRERER
jgi:hypothetical protein